MEAVKAKGVFPLKDRIQVFLGSCAMRTVFEDGNEGLVGRCSLSVLRRFSFTQGAKAPWPVIEVGNFAEAAKCCVQIGGEHANSRIFNNSLGSLPLLRGHLRNQGIFNYQGFHPTPTRIGHGVILSRDCLLLPGAQIGIGAVIGAGAVVSKSPVPDFAVVGGVPAHTIKERISTAQQEMAHALAWWNWDMEFFVRNAHLLLDAETHFETLRATCIMDEERYRLVVSVEGRDDAMTFGVLGYDDQGNFVPMSAAPPDFQVYFAQMTATEGQELTWMPNPFRLL